MTEEFFLENEELFQYVGFFGGMLVFGLMEIFNPAIHRSPERLTRWRTNYAMTILGILLLGLLPLTSIAASLWARDEGIGLFNIVDAAPWIVVISTLLVRSFVSWLVHWASHKNALLWRFHRVHHFDTHLDVSTTFRLHPIESLIGFVVVIPTVIAFGLSPWTLVLYETLDASVTVFTHANIRLPRSIDRVTRLLFVTPDMHRIHHSSHQTETDSNYGAVFSFWDRIFFTYTAKATKEPNEMELGLETIRDKRSHSFFWLIVSPFLRA